MAAGDIDGAEAAGKLLTAKLADLTAVADGKAVTAASRLTVRQKQLAVAIEEVSASWGRAVS